MSGVIPQLTAKKKETLLKGIVEIGTVRGGCDPAEVTRATYYNWRKADKAFADAADAAFEQFYDEMEKVAWGRAKGKSDLLMIFLLKAGRPEKYRDNSTVTLQGSRDKPITFVRVDPLALAVLPKGSDAPVLPANSR